MPWLRLTLAVAVFLGGAWGGARWARTTEKPAAARQGSAPAPAILPPARSESASSATSVAPAGAGAPSSRSCDELLPQLAEWEAAALTRWLQAALPQPAGAGEDCIRYALLRLAEEDPVAALGLCQRWEEEPDSTRLSIVLGVLAHTNRPAVAAWIRQWRGAPRASAGLLWLTALEEVDARLALEWGIGEPAQHNRLWHPLSKLAARSETEAIAWLEALPAAYRTSGEGAIAGAWARRAPLAALAWAEQIGRTDVLQSALSAYAKNQPAEACAYIVGRSKEHRREWFLRRAVETWQEQDFEAARAYVQSLPGDLRRASAPALLETWVEKDPPGALEFAQMLEQGSKDSLIGQAVTRWAERNYDQAEAWVRALQAGPRRTQALQGLLESRRGVAEDPRRAVEFLRALPEADQERSLLERTFGNWAAQDPAAARQWALILPAGAAREAFLTQVIEQSAESDPALAADALRARWRESGTDGASLAALRKAAARVADSWGRQDPAAAAAWLGQLPAQAGSEAVFTALAERWSGRNPAQAFAWIQTLPAEQSAGPLGVVFRRFTIENPVTAIRTAQQLPPAARQAALQAIRSTWVEADPAAAQAWIQRDRPFGPEEQKGDDLP